MRRTLSPSLHTRGHTLLEVLVCSCVLLVALLGTSRSITDSASLSATNRETAQAALAVRETIETLQAEPFSQVFALHNEITADDPIGATGSAFHVGGLRPLRDDADGAVGRIVFPSSPGQPGML